MHEITNSRETWAPYVIDGLFVGPALNHYRCYQTHITETQCKHIANTLVWLPTLLDIPKTSSDNAGIISDNEFIYALKNPHPALPLTPFQDYYVTALKPISQIYKNMVPTNEDPPTPPRVIDSDKPTFQEHTIRTNITKLFDNVPFNGVITAFDPTVKYYHIKYDNGDEEDMDAYQIKNHLTMDKND